MPNSTVSAYDRVSKARAATRPTAAALINALFDGFFELHGDRLFADDKAIVGGVAVFEGEPVTVIGIERGGAAVKDKVFRNFGSPHPEGYRKALRLMKQAEKFRRPIVTIIDTAGAYCGIGAEERGQGSAIAVNLMEMLRLSVPIISIVLGEGESGGALAVAVADEVWLLENSVYSVISPEGAASILFKDASKAANAAEHLKLTAQDLHKLGLIDKIFAEYGDDFARTFSEIKTELKNALDKYNSLSANDLRTRRYEKFRAMGGAE